MAGPPPLRADAQRNRDKIIAAARAMFAERGLDAPLDEISKRAGVGSGTLYRHFPTRDDLITAVFLERAAENVAAMRRAEQHDDPWEGFASFVRATCRAQATDRGMADLIAIGHRRAELRVLRAEAYTGAAALIDRAKASGALRTDFSPQDLILLTMATAGITRFAGGLAPAAIDRFVAVALDGLRAQAATPAPPPIPPRVMLAQLRAATKASPAP